MLGLDGGCEETATSTDTGGVVMICLEMLSGEAQRDTTEENYRRTAGPHLYD